MALTHPRSFVPSSRTAPCDLCGSSRFEIVDQNDRWHEDLTTVVCAACGLLSHEHIPTDDELADYYAHQYRHDYHGEIEPSPHRVIRAWEGGRWLYRLLRPHLPQRGRVFEVGAGLGCTVKVFELAGYEASGIEPGQAFQRFSREQLQAQVTPGQLLEVLPQSQFDIILLVHVIEHLNSPRRALQHLRRLLTPDGQLYVECPNAGAPHAAPGRMFHPAHIYNFTPDTLEMLAESCGLRIAAQLAPRQGRELRYLLKRADDSQLQLRSSSYEQTRAALQRFTRWSYHCRWDYVRDRAGRDLRFLSQRLFARRRLRQIVAGCQGGSAQ